MKKNIIAFTFFLFFNISFCQTIEKDEINGTWKVEKNLTKTSDSRFKDLIEGFQTSTFGFEENGNFELYSPNKSKVFLMTLEIVKSKKWQFDNKRQLIRIGNLKDGFSTFGINVKKINEKIIFQISETELKFEMVKIK